MKRNPLNPRLGHAASVLGQGELKSQGTGRLFYLWSLALPK